MFKSLKNGINLHYEIKGNSSGSPLLFLHGNKEDISIFDGLIEYLKEYKLILVDSRMHGLSTGDELSYSLIKDDIKEFINDLGIENLSIVGFSDGAIVAMLLAKDGVKFNKLFLIGPNIKSDGLTNEAIESIKMSDDVYSKLCLSEPNISENDLEKINLRALVIGGENDLIKQDHLKLISDSLPNSYLYILSGASHFIPLENPKELSEIINNEMLVDVYYEDNHVIVVDKKSGILSQKDITEEDDILSITKTYLKNKYSKPGNVYLGLISRLDRNVSGLMVLSKTTKATTRLNEIRPKKTYLAIADGIIENEEGTLINHISKDEKNKKAFLDDRNGKEAILHYRTLEKCGNESLLEVKIETGRFHQIRFQLSNLGYPLLNDNKYGKCKNEDQFNIGLDAYKVSFIHPITKKIIEIERFPTRKIYKKFKFIK